MPFKIVSQLDADGYLVGPTRAYESPLSPGVYLIPRLAIDQPEPAARLPGKRYAPNGTGGWRESDAPPPIVDPNAPTTS